VDERFAAGYPAVLAQTEIAAIKKGKSFRAGARLGGNRRKLFLYKKRRET
jgi:hypothetical protein